MRRRRDCGRCWARRCCWGRHTAGCTARRRAYVERVFADYRNERHPYGQDA